MQKETFTGEAHSTVKRLQKPQVGLTAPASTKMAYSKQFVFDAIKALNPRKHNVQNFAVAPTGPRKETLGSSFEQELGGTGKLKERLSGKGSHERERDQSLPKLKLRLQVPRPPNAARTTERFFGVIGTGAKVRQAIAKDEQKFFRPKQKLSPASETTSNTAVGHMPKRPKSGDTNITKKKQIRPECRLQDKL